MSSTEFCKIYDRLRSLEAIVQQQEVELTKLRYEVADLQKEADVNSTKLSCW